MKFQKLTADQWRAAGLLGCRFERARGVLTLQFADRDEVWTRAPATYPTAGSGEVLLFDDEIFVYTPPGRPS